MFNYFRKLKFSGNNCDGNEKCYGGAARRATVIKKIKSNHENVLLLDAGDQSQGTRWYNVYSGSAAAHFLHELNYTAFAIGNHEFDKGVESFVDHFVNNITETERFPILSCNIDASLEPSMQGGVLNSYTEFLT